MSIEPLKFIITPVERIPDRVVMVQTGPLEFVLTPMVRVDGVLMTVSAAPLKFKMVEVIAPPEVLKIGKRWASIEAHLVQFNLQGEEETKEYLMRESKTFYDWLKESLGTRV